MGTLGKICICQKTMFTLTVNNLSFENESSSHTHTHMHAHTYYFKESFQVLHINFMDYSRPLETLSLKLTKRGFNTNRCKTNVQSI